MRISRLLVFALAGVSLGTPGAAMPGGELGRGGRLPHVQNGEANGSGLGNRSSHDIFTRGGSSGT